MEQHGGNYQPTVGPEGLVWPPLNGARPDAAEVPNPPIRQNEGYDGGVPHPSATYTSDIYVGKHAFAPDVDETPPVPEPAPQPQLTPPHAPALRTSVYSAPTKEEWRFFGKTLKYGAAVLMLAFSGTSIRSDQRDPTEAHAPSAAAIAAVEQRLALPDTPLAAQKGFPTQYETDSAVFQRREQIAKKDGVTIFDPSDTLRALRQTGSARLGPQAAIAAVDTYTQQYGDTVERAPRQKYSKGEHLRPATLAEMNTEKARDTLIEIVKERATIPKEATDGLAVRHIELMAPAPHKPDEVVPAGYTSVTANHDSIYINVMTGDGADIDGNIGIHTLAHEYGHHEDSRDSGSYDASAKDPSFVAAAGNPAYGYHYDHNLQPVFNGDYFTYDQYRRTRDANAQVVKRYAYTAGCEGLAEKANQIVDTIGAKTAFVRDYAAKDVREQKAEDISLLSEGEGAAYYYSEMFSPELPLLREQLVYALARIGTTLPNVRDFYIDLAYKHQQPYQPQDLTDLCK